VPLNPALDSIDFVNRPQTPAEFHEILALRNRSVILQFVVILVSVCVPELEPPP
jgi:hypothetical protein